MKSLKYLLAISMVLLPSAALAQQFTPQQMLEVMTKSQVIGMFGCTMTIWPLIKRFVLLKIQN